MVDVTHYGIHWSGDVAFLEQQKAVRIRGQIPEASGTNALGLKVKSPFRVLNSKRCNHAIALATNNPDVRHVEAFNELLTDPLVDAMLPLPKTNDGCYLVETPELSPYLGLLAQMSSPIEPIVIPIWNVTQKRILDELGVTNVQPLVLVQASAADTAVLNRISDYLPQLPRRLVVIGDAAFVVPHMLRRIQTKITEHPLEDLMLIPWATMGAVMVRKFMRGEL